MALPTERPRRPGLYLEFADDGYKRRRGSKGGYLGPPACRTYPPADEQERAQVRTLCEQVQQASGHTVELAWADQGYTGGQARQAAQDNGIDLQIVKLPAKCWVVERSFGWLARCRRLSRDYERLPQVLSGLHFLVFAVLMLPTAAQILASTESL